MSLSHWLCVGFFVSESQRASGRWQPRGRAHILTRLTSSLVPLMKMPRQSSVGTSACTHTRAHTPPLTRWVKSPSEAAHLRAGRGRRTGAPGQAHAQAPAGRSCAAA